MKQQKNRVDEEFKKQLKNERRKISTSEQIRK